MMYLQSRGMFPLALSGNVEADVLNKNPGTADMSPLKYAFVCTLEILKELKAATMAPFDPWTAKGTLNLWGLASVLPLPAQITLTKLFVLPFPQTQPKVSATASIMKKAVEKAVHENLPVLSGAVKNMWTQALFLRDRTAYWKWQVAEAGLTEGVLASLGGL